MHGVRSRAQQLSILALGLSWLTVAWVVISYATYQGFIHLPASIQGAVALSGAIALLGAAFGLVSLLVGARDRSTIIASVLAVLLNGLWVWLLFESIYPK